MDDRETNITKSEGGKGQKGQFKSRLLSLSVAALGVVFGDIGTSPLYAIRECFHGEYGIPVSKENIFGVLSLVFWALIIIVTIKYLTFVLRADNEGEGGVLALTALLKKEIKDKYKINFIALGLFGACLLYGDGMITPAISVLSAVEGLHIITPLFKPYILPITALILAFLFYMQRRGTGKIGNLFGPIILVWFLILAILGGIQIAQNPRILTAVLPWHGVDFLIHNKLKGFMVLGAIFLVVTGAEALYADIGHFGKAPIRLSWLLFAFPSLVLNYFGQGAVLLIKPQMSHHPFYALVPHWALIPMVILSTVATVIASQAVISGAFSLTLQAIKFGYLPRLHIKYTSASHMGQIYIGTVNWLLMICSIALVVGFRTSSKLAAAYGVAVTVTMLITTTLFFILMRMKWKWNLMKCLLLAAFFLFLEIPFFFANISKLFHGAWFPLVIAAGIFIVMSTWQEGNNIIRNKIRDLTPKLEGFKNSLKEISPKRVKGAGVFLTRSHDIIPSALIQNLKHNKVLHSTVLLLSIRTEQLPRVPNMEKVETEKLGSGIYRVIAHYGFMEKPDIETIFTLSRDKGLNIDLNDASFFLGREKIGIGRNPQMSPWRSNLFIFLSRNSVDVSSYFGIPSDKTIEIGTRVEI